jgi:hypothetical protein
MTTSHFEIMFLRPRTSRRRCSVCEELLASAATAHLVRHATWFVSHIWSNPFADTVDAILNFFERREDCIKSSLDGRVCRLSACGVRCKQRPIMVHVHVQEQHRKHWQLAACG